MLLDDIKVSARLDNIKGSPTIKGTSTDERDPMAINLEVPAAWQEVDRLVDLALPGAINTAQRNTLGRAITELVIDAELRAVKEHGDQILESIAGQQFSDIRATCLGEV